MFIKRINYIINEYSELLLKIKTNIKYNENIYITIIII